MGIQFDRKNFKHQKQHIEKADKILTHSKSRQQSAFSSSPFIHQKAEQGFFAPKSSSLITHHSSLDTQHSSFIQPKLKISQPGDPYEQEADAMADKVMRMSEPAASAPVQPKDEESIQRKEEPAYRQGREEQIQPREEEEVQPKLFVNASGSLVQRKEGEEEEVQASLEEEPVQKKEEDEEPVQPSLAEPALPKNNHRPIHFGQGDFIARKERGPPTVSPQFTQQLHSNKAGGQSLDTSSRSFMESRFQADFSRVKVHTDTQAVQMNRSIGAQAFTHGNHVYFNAGKYNPGTGTGRQLLAHELTHTIQQGAASSVLPFRQTSVKRRADESVQTSALEEEPVQAKTEPNANAPPLRPELKKAVAHAKSQEGKVNAGLKNPDGSRQGWERLSEYFKSAMGPDKVIPEGGIQTPGSILEKNIKYSSTVKAPQPNKPITDEWKKRDAMPSWCGIFVFWSLNKGGVPMPKWTIGGGAVKLKAAYPPSYIPKPGDIAYFNTNSHYAIVEKTEPENPAPSERNKVKVVTVNGNTAGENNLGGQVQSKSHPIKHWEAFFNPLYGIEDKMPPNPAEVSEAELQAIIGEMASQSASSAGAAPSEAVGVTAYTPTPRQEKTPAQAAESPGTETKPADPLASPTAAEEAPKEEVPVASPKSPEEDPAYQAVLGKTKGAKQKAKSHGDAGEKSAAAQLASEVDKKLDVDSQAQYHQVGAMNVQKAGTFSKETFKNQLMERVKKALPKNDKETVDMYEDSTGVHDRMEEAKTNAKGDVKAEKDKAGNAIATTTTAPPDPKTAVPKVSKPMALEEAGKKSYIPKAEDSAPKPKTDSELSMEKEAASLDDEMAKDNVTETQLANSNEPKFTGALSEKQSAQEKARNTPNDYRAKEDPQLAKAKATAEGTVQGNMADLHSTKENMFGKVDGSKSGTKSKDEAKRKEIADNLQRMYKATKEKVEGILNKLETDVTDEFDKAANAANADFEKRVRKRLKDFYGWTTVDDTISEWVSGMDPEITRIFEEERDRYIENMDTAINAIASKVETELNAAMTAIEEGKKEVDKYWNSLDPETQKIGDDAKKEIDDQFKELENTVQEKHDALVEKLSDRYVKNLEQLQETFDKIKAENQGWLSGALNAIKAVIETIISLKNMLFETLARIAKVIGDIIGDPIGFLGNLVTAVGMGLNNFVTNIATHLKKGLFEWLLGNMPPGIQFPDKWDLTGIFQFIMQILGLTWTNIRQRAVKKLGEPVVSALEEVFEIFQIIRKEGLAGLWRYIKDKVGDLKVMVIDAIESFLIEKIIKAGIMWVIGLLNPVGAFIKACQAIYKIVMFFIEKGKQIMEFVNTVIDSIANIVAGNLGGAAKMVEDALAKLIPLAIGFLASLLGLDGVSEKVQKIIKAIQAPINKAIDWVLDKAIALSKKLGLDKLMKKVKGGIQKGKDWAKKKMEQGKDWAKEKIADFKSWVSKVLAKMKKSFTTKGGESHTMYFQTGGKPELYIRSTPMRGLLFLNNKEKEIKASTMPEPDRSTQLQLVKEGQQKITAINALIYPADQSKPVPANHEQQIDILMGDLVAIISLLDPGGKEEVVPAVKYSPGFTQNKAGRFEAAFIFKDKAGKKNHQEGEKSTDYTGTLGGAIPQLRAVGLRKKWVAFHIVNAKLGGKAIDSNLIPTPGYINSEFHAGVETHLKKYYHQHIPVWLQAEATYGANPAFVTQFNAIAGTHEYKNGQWVNGPSNTNYEFSKNIDEPLPETFAVNQIPADESEWLLIANLTGITKSLLRMIRDNKGSTVFTSIPQLETFIDNHVGAVGFKDPALQAKNMKEAINKTPLDFTP